MSDATDLPEARVAFRRFADARALREWVADECSSETAGAPDPVLVIAPTGGAGELLEAWLRERLPVAPGRAAIEAEVNDPSAAFRELGQVAAPPVQESPVLVRTVLLEDALDEHRDAPGAPPGDPMALAGPLLRLAERQAADRDVAEQEPAFEALASRAIEQFSEAAEGDPGAVRLLALAEWMRDVLARYRERLDETGSVDPEGLRRAVLASADAIRDRFRWGRVLVLGEDTLGVAEWRVLGAVAPPGALQWGVVGSRPSSEGSPARLPDLGAAGIRVEEAPEDGAGEEPGPDAGPPPGRMAPASESASLPMEPPCLLIPEARSGAVRDSGADPLAGLLFRATDLEDEMRLAAQLVTAFADDPDSGFRSFERCAIVARNPARYLAAAATVLPTALPPGLPGARQSEEAGGGRGGFQSSAQPSLAAEPWPAAITDVLEFAERPGRLSNGMRLLRGTFFEDDDLDVSPGRAADIVEQALDRLGKWVPDTNGPDVLAELVGRFREHARDCAAKAEHAERRSPDGGDAWRHRRDAEAAAVASRTMRRLDACREMLRLLTEETADFRSGVAALLKFLQTRFGREPEGTAPEGEARASDRAIEALGRAADAMPDGAGSGQAARLAPRIHRLLRSRQYPRCGGKSGVRLIAAEDAGYGDFDLIVLVGVADADWPTGRPGNIFLPDRVLEPSTRDRNRGWRDREKAMLRAFPDLPARAAAFIRADLEDGFPVGCSPLAAELRDAMDPDGSRKRTPVPKPTESRDVGGLSPLPQVLDRNAPSAGDLEKRISPTSISDYDRCASNFFARRELWLNEERPSADSLPNLRRGSLLHDLLETQEKFFEANGPVTAETLDAAADFLRREFEEVADRLGVTGGSREAERRWLFGGRVTPASMIWFLREDAALAARAPAEELRAEAKLDGRLATEPPFAQVRGKADRVDVRPDSIRILEYKSGRRYAKKEPLQALIYQRLVQEAHAGRPVASYVVFFGNRELWSMDEKGEELQLEKVQNVAAGVAAGAFPAAGEDRDGGCTTACSVYFCRPDLAELATPPSEGDNEDGEADGGEDGKKDGKEIAKQTGKEVGKEDGRQDANGPRAGSNDRPPDATEAPDSGPDDDSGPVGPGDLFATPGDAR